MNYLRKKIKIYANLKCNILMVNELVTIYSIVRSRQF